MFILCLFSLLSFISYIGSNRILSITNKIYWSLVIRLSGIWLYMFSNKNWISVFEWVGRLSICSLEREWWTRFFSFSAWYSVMDQSQNWMWVAPRQVLLWKRGRFSTICVGLPLLLRSVGPSFWLGCHEESVSDFWRAYQRRKIAHKWPGQRWSLLHHLLSRGNVLEFIDVCNFYSVQLNPALTNFKGLKSFIY